MRIKEKLSEFVSRTIEPEQLFSWHFDEAMKHYRDANADLSVRHFRECSKIFPERWLPLQQLSGVYSQLIGDVEESLRLLRYAQRLRERRCTPPAGRLPYRFLQDSWAARLDSLAEIERLVKREILQGRDPRRIVLYLPGSRPPANRTLLEKMGAYITIVRDEEKLPAPPETMLSVLEEPQLCESLDGLAKHPWHAASEILRAWETAGRAPLLALSEEETRKGRAALKELGLPDDAWFATLDVEGAMNVEISAYLPAMRAVVERGGWVIRSGERTARPLPAAAKVIDYARSTHKSEWMDIYLLGACRFFIGTASGPAHVPPLFGIPCVLTSWSPAGQRPFNDRDLYIPSLYRAGFPARPLTFPEMMAPPVGYAPRYVRAEELGLTPVPNTSEEIRETVGEMLDRLDGALSYTEMDDALQSAFDVVAETNLCIGNARIGCAFLRRHSHLLTEMEQQAPRAAIFQGPKTSLS